MRRKRPILASFWPRSRGRSSSKARRMSDPLDDLIDAATRALDLPVEPAWKAAVRRNLDVTLRHAQRVCALVLGREGEAARVCVACAICTTPASAHKSSDAARDAEI